MLPTHKPEAKADELAAMMLEWMRRVAKLPGELEAMQMLGMSLPQMMTMHILRAPAGAAGMTVTALADRLGLSASATSTLTQRLVELGLVERTEDADDRRVKRLTLTMNGISTVDRMLAHRLVEMSTSMAPLTTSTRNLLRDAIQAVLRELPDPTSVPTSPDASANKEPS
jgi:DNA-binding MarR family transcriptional regulator